MKKIKLLLVIITIISLINTDIVPQADTDLIQGFMEGSGIKSYVKSSSCENEFNSFSLHSSNLIEAIINNDKIKILDSLGETGVSLCSLYTNCNGFKQNLQILLVKFYKVFIDPQKFLISVLDKIVSIHTISDWWGLKSKIKDRKFYEGGVVIGDILAYITNFEDNLSDIVIPKRYLAVEKSLKPRCMLTLKNLLIELAKITFDIYLKSTEIDIFELLKLLNDIREACT